MASIITIVIGVIGIVAGVVIAVLMRKKPPIGWIAALLVVSLVCVFTGGGLLYANMGQAKEDTCNVYMALRYLQYRKTDEANYYLQKVTTATFDSAATGVAMETYRGNTLLARMKLDGLESDSKGKTKGAIVDNLHACMEGTGDLDKVVKSLLEYIDIDDDLRDELDLRFASETGILVGDVDEDDLEDAQTLEQKVNAALMQSNYKEAVEYAAELVSEKPNERNRLMLAECIAECTYTGETLTGEEFEMEPLSRSEEQNLSVNKEREKINEQIEDLDRDISRAERKLEAALTDKDIASAQETLDELQTQRQELQDQVNYVFARRALSSIADIHSLEAAVIRARLYFAMKDINTATETLTNAANSLQARLTTDPLMNNQMRILRETYSGQSTTGTRSQEFQDAIKNVVFPSSLNMVGVLNSPITRDMVELVASDAQSYGTELYISSVDITNYPEITVYLGGQQKIKDLLLKKQNVVVRDTKEDVSYTVREIKGDEADSMVNVVCVVDESGSMSGDPVNMLKLALTSFVSTADDEMEIGIVGFENDSRIIAPLGISHAVLTDKVNDIHASGGTDVASGIIGGLNMLEGQRGSRVMLLMSDGQSNVSDSVLQDAVASGVVIHTIGFGGADENMLSHIAEVTGGQYVYAQNTTDLVGVYRSMVGIMGNEIAITYTVSNTTEREEARYFYIGVENTASVRREYTLTLNQTSTGPKIQTVTQALNTTEYVDWYRNEYGDFEVNVWGSGFARVAEAELDGETCTITEQSDTYMEFTVDLDARARWLTLKLTTVDGTEYTFEHFMAVAEELEFSNFTMGPLTISPYECGLIGDQLVVEDAYFRDTTDRSGVVEMNVDGLVWFDVDADALRAYAGREDNDNPYDLGQGTPKGTGVCQIQFQDRIHGSSYNVAAVGDFHFDYDGSHFRVVQE